jgi:hypothetical protein
MTANELEEATNSLQTTIQTKDKDTTIDFEQ